MRGPAKYSETTLAYSRDIREDITEIASKIDYLRLKQEAEHELRTGLNEDTNDDIKQENVTIHNKIGEVCVKLQEIRQVTGAR